MIWMSVRQVTVQGPHMFVYIGTIDVDTNRVQMVQITYYIF